jgi:RHS repeat-associated protein
MMMPGREYQAQPNRFGFNGKENDNEVKGFGNQQDYGMRIYDARLSRFLSVDPLTKSYPFYSPYQFAGNSPVANIDLDGAEPKPSTNGTLEGQSTSTSEEKYTSSGMGYGSSYTASQTWYWHSGGVSQGNQFDKQTKRSYETFSQAGWYSAKDYQKILTPLASDLVGYLGLSRYIPGGSWSDERRKSVLNSDLGKFLNGRNVSSGFTDILFKKAQDIAYKANFNATGVCYPSSFNVEDLLGLGLIVKAGLKAIGTSLAKQLYSRATNNIIKEFGRINLGLPEGFSFFSLKTDAKTQATSLIEHYTMEGAIYGGDGVRTAIMGVGTSKPLSDPALRGLNVTKYQYVHYGVDATGKQVSTAVHYLQNNDTGLWFDFKFK